MKPIKLICCFAVLLPLAGCEQLGLESMQSMAKKQETEGHAVGGACRQAGRAIEDCYTLNRKMARAPIYDGWREMDGYMRENKMEATAPKLASQPPLAPAVAAATPEPAAAAAGRAPEARRRAETAPARAAWTPPATASARQAAVDHARDDIWSSRTDTRVSDAQSATAPAPALSGQRLNELEEAARRMGLSTSVVR